MDAALPCRYLEDLVAKRRIEKQLLEQQLEKRAESKGYVLCTDASYPQLEGRKESAVHG